MEQFPKELVALATSELVGSLEKLLIQNGYDIGTGAESSKIVHNLFDQIMDYAKEERSNGHELY